MRIWVISDLHLEFDDGWLPMIPDADVCVCAGDVMQGCGNSIRWLDQHIAPAMPVVMVAGNHEFYSHSIVEGLEWARVHAAECPRVHFLENDVVVIGGVRFVGCTLWSDFELDGDVAWAAANFEGRLNDSRAIAWRKLPSHEGFTAKRVQELHARSRRFLEHSLMYDGPTVVVTHHAPHPCSVNAKWEGSSLNPSFASDMTDVIVTHRPDLWAHGHMHDSSDYLVAGTRVIANPKGYGGENPAFDPSLVVEV
jgi:predicted phosphohydrolase